MAEGFHLLSSGGWQHPRRSELSTPLQLEAFCHWAGGAEGILEHRQGAGICPRCVTTTSIQSPSSRAPSRRGSSRRYVADIRCPGRSATLPQTPPLVINQHLHLGIQMPSGDIHPINAHRQGKELWRDQLDRVTDIRGMIFLIFCGPSLARAGVMENRRQRHLLNWIFLNLLDISKKHVNTLVFSCVFMSRKGYAMRLAS